MTFPSVLVIKICWFVWQHTTHWVVGSMLFCMTSSLNFEKANTYVLLQGGLPHHHLNFIRCSLLTGMCCCDVMMYVLCYAVRAVRAVQVSWWVSVRHVRTAWQHSGLLGQHTTHTVTSRKLSFRTSGVWFEVWMWFEIQMS